MPRISEFYGIVIEMYWNDHNPPHFHATYSGQNVSVNIATFEVMEGRISNRARRLIQEWASLHQHELLERWHQVRNRQTPPTIEPLPDHMRYGNQVKDVRALGNYLLKLTFE